MWFVMFGFCLAPSEGTERMRDFEFCVVCRSGKICAMLSIVEPLRFLASFFLSPCSLFRFRSSDQCL